MGLVKNLCRGDAVIWVIFFILLAISLIEVFSATSQLTYGKASHWVPFTSHCIMVFAGIVIAVVCHRIPYQKFRLFGSFLYPISVFMLIYIIFSGLLINNAARWFDFFGLFRFQPSELAKISVIILVSMILSLHKESDYKSKKSFIYVLVVSLVMCVLILKENFSTAAILFMVVYFMMFIGRIPNVQMLKLTGVGLLLVSVFMLIVFVVPDDVDTEFFKRFPVWKTRIIDFVTPIDCAAEDYVINDDNNQTTYANIAVASSDIIGCMPGNSVQRDYLPQAYSDFIYAIIIEEMGLLGGIFVLILYLILLIRAGRIARRCDKAFPAYLVMGLAMLLVLQATVNMAVSVGLFPVTGQNLPLVSRGGTSMLMSCLSIGMILSVSRTNEERLLKQKMEKEAAHAVQGGDEINDAEESKVENEKD